VSASALRSQDGRQGQKMRLKEMSMSQSTGAFAFDRSWPGAEGASKSAPLLGRRRSAPPGARKRRGFDDKRPVTTSGAPQDGRTHFPSLARSPQKTLLSKQRKTARQEVNEVMKFDQAFQLAYRRAVLRTAAERKQMSQMPMLVSSGSSLCVRELLGLKKLSSPSLFSRRISKEESSWGSEVLRRIPGQLSKEEEAVTQTIEGRRKSSIQQSFTSFGDVVLAAQAAARRDINDSSPMSSKGGESRRNSLRRGSAVGEEFVAKLLRRRDFSNTDLASEFELTEILDPPAPSQMYTRFKVEDIANFPAAEQERIREAFYRFKSIGSSDIDVGDLEKALIHLGYLKIDPEVIAEITQKLTKFATLDLEEYIRFMGGYTSYERSEVQRVFREFDEDNSGSLDTQEIEGVMRSFNITPFKSTVEAAIAVVDEDHTGTVEFHEFVHLLTVYKKTEGFSQSEVRELYAVFYNFAVSVPDSKLREVPVDCMPDALMNLFAPQTFSLGVGLVNEVLVVMRKKKEEKAAKKAMSRQQGTAAPEEPGMQFREFLVWARRLREAEIAEYRRKFDTIDFTGTGFLQHEDLKEAFELFGYTSLQSELDDLLDRKKIPKGVAIDFESFVSLVQDFSRTDGFSRRDVDEYLTVFRAFDTSGLGEVGVLQIASILRWLGFSIELEAADSYFQSVNFDGSATMGFAGFLQLMRLHRDIHLHQLKEVFEQNCESEAFIKQDLLQQVLTDMDRRVSVSVIGQCLQGVEDSRHIDFDGFVQVIDNMRRHSLDQIRKQAGFTDQEVRTFRQAFQRYDTDGNERLTRDEMPPLLRDLGIDLRTVDDQRHFVRLVEEARSSAKRGGATEEEAGAQGSSGITYWTFVHFLRVLQTEDDVKTVSSQTRSHLFSEKEQEELQVVFRTWCEHFAEVNQRGEGLGEEASPSPDEKASSTDLKLTHSQLWSLLRELGIPLNATHVKLLKARVALDSANTLPVEYRGHYVNASGFLQLLSWMLDANFASIREKSEEAVEGQRPVEI